MGRVTVPPPADAHRCPPSQRHKKQRLVGLVNSFRRLPQAPFETQVRTERAPRCEKPPPAPFLPDGHRHVLVQPHHRHCWIAAITWLCSFSSGAAAESGSHTQGDEPPTAGGRSCPHEDMSLEAGCPPHRCQYPPGLRGHTARSPDLHPHRLLAGHTAGWGPSDRSDKGV